MGEGHFIKCKNCGTKYGVITGIGMMFPSVYGETVEKIRNGDYGEELNELLLTRPYLAVDCELDLYVCDCGHWETEENLDVYEPIDEEMRKEREKNLSEDYRDYVIREDLKEDYRLVRHHTHICSKCGKEMKKIKRPEYYARKFGLKCPVCGEKNTAEYENMILWD